MINLILFGPPGSGKGTQAENLIEKYQLVHLSTGDIFRHNIKNSTPLGVEAKSYIDKGALVPDSVTINMLKDQVESNPDAKGFIFDGFPRTIAQAEALDAFLSEKGTEISKLLELKVDDEEIVARILNRGKTSGRSDDNNPEIIQNRINVYKEQTSPVAGYYGKKDKSVAIEGIGTLEEVFQRLSSAIDG